MTGVRTTSLAAGLDVVHDGISIEAIHVRLPEHGILATIHVPHCSAQEDAVLDAVRAEEGVLSRCGSRHDPFEHGMDEDQAVE